MNEQLDSIEITALRLSKKDRAMLVDRLIVSLDEDVEGPPEEIKAAWDAEVLGRLDRMDRGETTLIAGDEAALRIRAAAQGKH